LRIAKPGVNGRACGQPFQTVPMREANAGKVGAFQVAFEPDMAKFRVRGLAR